MLKHMDPLIVIRGVCHCEECDPYDPVKGAEIARKLGKARQDGKLRMRAPGATEWTPVPPLSLARCLYLRLRELTKWQ